MPDLSIIIVNFNTKNLLKDCVESIHKSKPKLSYEVIVVDNGSKDGSLKALKDLWREKKVDKYFENNKNFGLSKATNIGIKSAKGKYMLMLNTDTIVRNKALDILMEFARKRKDVGAVAPKLLNLDGSVQPSVFKFPTISRTIQQYWLGQKRILDKYSPRESGPTAVEIALGAAFLITPKGMKKAGLMDERYFLYYEDFEYCRRLKSADLKVYYLPKAEIVHIHGASGGNIKQLVESSKIYHGIIKHYIIQFILWSGQKWQNFLKRLG